MSTLKIGAIIFALALLVVLAAAITTALANPAGARGWLDLEPQPPGGLRDLVAILARNSSLVGAIVVLARCVDQGLSSRLADVALVVVATVNLLLAGAAVGAYGAGLGLRFAIYGPLELAAFSLAGASYIDRRRPTHPSAPPVVVGLIAAALVVAACAESYLPSLA